MQALLIRGSEHQKVKVCLGSWWCSFSSGTYPSACPAWDKAIKNFTDGSKLDDYFGSGIYIEKPGNKLSISLRNPDFSSVFKSELIAIEHGLEAILNENDFGDLWILSDSRTSLHSWR